MEGRTDLLLPANLTALRSWDEILRALVRSYAALIQDWEDIRPPRPVMSCRDEVIQCKDFELLTILFIEI